MQHANTNSAHHYHPPLSTLNSLLPVCENESKAKGQKKKVARPGSKGNERERITKFAKTPLQRDHFVLFDNLPLSDYVCECFYISPDKFKERKLHTL
jgi:hypothetical protein